MFGRYQVTVPSGFRPLINGDIVKRTRSEPIFVKKYDQVCLISYVPSIIKKNYKAICREGVTHNLAVTIKLRIQENSLPNILRNVGDSNFHNPTNITAESIANQQKVMDSIEASVQAYIHTVGLFDLEDRDSVRQALDERVKIECAEESLIGEVVLCDVEQVLPEFPRPIESAKSDKVPKSGDLSKSVKSEELPELDKLTKSSFVSELAAKAGIRINKETENREYSDFEVGKVVEYLIEIEKQNVLMQAESEKAKADAQIKIMKARTKVKIDQLDQDELVSKHAYELSKAESDRQLKIKEINAEVMEKAAEYDFKYKQKRQEEELKLIPKTIEIARAKDGEMDVMREIKEKDIKLDMTLESQKSKIKTESFANLFNEIGKMPSSSYPNVQTLITSDLEDINLKKFVVGLALEFLGGKPADTEFLAKSKRIERRET